MVDRQEVEALLEYVEMRLQSDKVELPPTVSDDTLAAQQPAALDEAMVERIAALLHEEATDEPWTVADVEHDGPDRDYYRALARKVIVSAGQQGGVK